MKRSQLHAEAEFLAGLFLGFGGLRADESFGVEDLDGRVLRLALVRSLGEGKSAYLESDVAVRDVTASPVARDLGELRGHEMRQGLMALLARGE